MAVNYDQFKKYDVPCLYIVCNKCKLTTQNPDDKCKSKETGSKGAGCKMSSCKNKDRHVYKVRVKVNEFDKSEKQKVLHGDFFDVIKDADKFKNLVREKNETIFLPNSAKPTLTSVFASFLAYKNDDGIVAYKAKNITKDYIEELFSYISKFLKVLISNGINPEIFPIEDIGEKHIDLFVTELESAKYAPSYFNKHIKALKELTTYSNNYFKTSIDTIVLFDGALQYVGESENKMLTMEEFEFIINGINWENGKYRKGKKQEQSNYHRDWLIHAFYLCLFSGRRREEIINLKWSNVVNNKGSFFLTGANLKTIRMKKIKNNKEKQWVAPVFPQFYDFLVSIGLNDKMGSDEFILKISNRETVMLRTICDNFSKAFTHFSKKAGFDYKRNDLKNTYISNLSLIMGDNTNVITDHASLDVVKNNYLNPYGLHAEVGKKMMIQ